MRRWLFGRFYVWEQYVSLSSIAATVLLLVFLLLPALSRARQAAHRALATSAESNQATEPSAESYLRCVQDALALCRADMAAMQPAAEEAARRLAEGGTFWAGGQPSMVSELSGRAGGFMMLRNLAGSTPDPGDVVLYFLAPGIPEPETLPLSTAYVVVFGEQGHESAYPCFANHASEAGISPTLANAIPGWVFTGEIVAALTRLGRMPVIYESIGSYSGNARIVQYENGAIAWHDAHEVTPVAPGVLGNRFLDTIGGLLRRVGVEEREALDRAGAWAAEAHAQGNRLFMYSMGHLFPDEIGKTDIGTLFHSDVWNAGFRTSEPPPDTFAPGDLIVHIGYQHPPSRLLERARPAGARVIYVSLRSHRDYMHDPGVIWIDPMWPWSDAVVPLDGYDIPLLAASGIVNGAIAWEVYRVTVLAERS